MSRRTMSERMCTGLMLCEAAPCDPRFNDRCVLPKGTGVPQNKSINEILMDRSGNSSQILIRRQNPNPPEIANIKVKIDADLINLLNDTSEGKLSDVNVDQYFSMIMAAHRLTEKDTEYETIKSIAENLPKGFSIFVIGFISFTGSAIIIGS